MEIRQSYNRNMEKIFTEKINAYVGEDQCRKRDVRFKDYRGTTRKSGKLETGEKKKYFQLMISF